MSSGKIVQRLYRIMDFEHVVQLFEKKELYFANPSTWDDPYEQLIKHSKDHALFGQCWSRSSASDALWRIYSKNGMGVRISTTTETLTSVIRNGIQDKGYKLRVGRVKYVTQKALNAKAAEVVAGMQDMFAIGEAVDMLYVKRNAFRHENEYRATIYCPDEEVADKKKKGITISIEPNELINNILLDPRAPDKTISALKKQIKEKLGFDGKVEQSVLYKVPKSYAVNGVFLDAKSL